MHFYMVINNKQNNLFIYILFYQGYSLLTFPLRSTLKVILFKTHKMSLNDDRDLRLFERLT